ncbi:MAG: hypothetical protein R3C68_17630 [Myxococcota bacterium]
MFDAGRSIVGLATCSPEIRTRGALRVRLDPVKYVAVGVNFTHFSDDLLADPNQTQQGVFLRVTGRY